jgi:AcrR family transcriptional regulator
VVTTAAPAGRAYHHGNLRAALVAAGLELTRTGGPAALVLRDATRRAGVSPNAAYRHFADRDGLLRAVTEQVQAEVADRMTGLVVDPSPRAGLRAVGLGYIDFALREPGWFQVAFGEIDPQPTEPGAADVPLPAPLLRLVQALDALVVAGELTPANRAGAEWPCWSAVHGFALLALHGPLRRQPADVVRHAAERTVDAIIAGVLR